MTNKEDSYMNYYEDRLDGTCIIKVRLPKDLVNQIAQIDAQVHQPDGKPVDLSPTICTMLRMLIQRPYNG